MVEELQLDLNDKVQSVLCELYKTTNEDVVYAFRKMDTQKQLLQWLASYRHFNDVFAPCVIDLASKIHLYFNDTGKNVLGSKMASGIYAACEHEYQEKINNKSYTHSELSYIFINKLKSIVDKSFNTTEKTELVDSYIHRVKNGYGVNLDSTIDTISKSIGFHIASEFLAAFEFETIHKLTQKEFPEVFEEMNEEDEVLGTSPWHWIFIHSTVEIEHFKTGLRSYNIGKQDLVINKVVEGILEFNKLQKEFLNNIL
jgi:hypothetical protein